MHKGARRIVYKEGSFTNCYGTTILQEVESVNGKRKGLFRCVCGKEFIADISLVKGGHTKGCGCYRRKIYELGEVIGPYGVTFVRDAGVHTTPGGQKKRKSIFMCPLCGAEFESHTDAVRRGLVRSCGCYIKLRERYSPGQKIGSHGIAFVSELKGRDRGKKAVFKCHCGETFTAFIENVRRGNTTSCGCIGNRNGWSRTAWKKHLEAYHKKVASVYVLRLYYDKDWFIKVGLTTKPIKSRFGSKLTMPFKHEVIRVAPIDAVEAFDLEKKIHKSIRPMRHLIMPIFGGFSECYEKSALPVVMEILDTYLNEHQTKEVSHVAC